MSRLYTSSLSTLDRVTRYAYRSAIKRGLRHHEAQDIAQEVAVLAWASDSFPYPGTWVGTCVRNIAEKDRRKQGGETRQPDGTRLIGMPRLEPVGLPRDSDLGDFTASELSVCEQVLSAAEDTAPLPGEVDRLQEFSRLLPHYLDAIPELYREALVLWAEVGNLRGSMALGIDVEAFRSRVRKGMARLRQLVLAEGRIESLGG